MKSTTELFPVPTQAPAAVPTVTPPPRMATAVVRGIAIQVPCPDWCVYEHPILPLRFLEDLDHEGAHMSLSIPVADGSDSAMVVYLSQYPFAEREADRAVRVALEVAGDGQTVELDAALGESVAAGMERHAALLRALTGQLATA